MNHSCFYSRLIALILVLLKSGFIFVRAQQPNEWPLIWDNIRLNFECNQKSGFTVNKENSKIISFGGLYSPIYFINDTTGKIKYFISEDSCYNQSHQFLKNSNYSNNDKYKYDWQIESAYYTPILKIAACRSPVSQRKYYIFNQISTDYKKFDTLKQNMRIVYRVLEDSINNGLGGFRDKNFTYLSNLPLFFQNVVPFNNNKGFWLIAKGLNKYYVYKIDKNGINRHDSIINNETFRVYWDCIMSPMGTRLLSFNLSNNNYSTFFEPNIKNIEITVYDFDKTTGKLSYLKKIDFTLLYKSLSTANYAFPVSFSFSPNDSLLYVNSYDGRLNAPNRSFNSQMLVNDNSKFYFIDSTGDQQHYTSYSGIVSNSGKLYFTSEQIGNPSPQIAFGCINKVNNFGKSCEYVANVKKYYSMDYTILSNPYSFPYSNGTYKPLYLNYKKGCNGIVTLYSMLDSFYTKAILNLDGKNIHVSKQNRDSVLVNLLPGKHYIRLTAISGTYYDVCLYDSLTIEPPPIASFTTSDTIGCQWLGFRFNDSSKSQLNTSSYFSNWNFGDGKDTIISGKTLPLKSPIHIYTKEGDYKVQLVFDNGQCKDTFTQLKNVKILAAPQPGITATPLTGCTPLKVNFKYKYSDVLDSAVWRSGEAASPSIKGITGNFLYNQVGNFWLAQKLYGPSGCITQDSVEIKVNPGISGMPDILNATVTYDLAGGETIDLTWKQHLNAVSYSIIKNNNFLTRTTNTYYTDKKANTLMPNSYTIKAISICNDSSVAEDLAQTIYLHGQRTDNNEAKLNWTAYQRWDFGVNTYQLFSQNATGNFELMATLSSQTLEFLDEGFAGLSEAQRCYKIIADEKDGNLQQSSSNVLCIPLSPILLIPSAFSPNGDGVNDTWKINYKGIKEAKIKIYNRWGEMVYLAKGETEKPEWDGKYKGAVVPDGAYFYQIEATGIKVGKVYKSGLVEVVR